MNIGPRTEVTLDSQSASAALEVLSNAAAAFALTRRERRTYRTLMVSADVAVLGVLLLWVMAAVSRIIPSDDARASWWFIAMAVVSVLCLSAAVSGLVATFLNLPLMRRVIREQSRLKALGMEALFSSLWKVQRRKRWIDRARGASFILVGGVYLCCAPIVLFFAIVRDDWILLLSGPYGLWLGALLLGARYIRAQKEKVELASHAIELGKALEGHGLKGDAGSDVVVPSELLVQIALVESAQITLHRRDAILESAGKQGEGYAIAFSREASMLRGALAPEDRMDLESLLADISAKGAQRAEPEADDQKLRAWTENRTVEIEYTVDRAKRSLLITSLARLSSDEAAMGEAASA